MPALPNPPSATNERPPRGRRSSDAPPRTEAELLAAKRETSRRSKAKRLSSDGLKHKAYYLPAALLENLDAYHRQTKKSRNQIVSEALAEYLNRHLP